jgi:hypothetical protein
LFFISSSLFFSAEQTEHREIERDRSESEIERLRGSEIGRVERDGDRFSGGSAPVEPEARFPADLPVGELGRPR